MRATIQFADRITCPYCGERHEEYTDYPVSLKHDGDSTIFTCEECETDFRVTLAVDIEYICQAERQ